MVNAKILFTAFRRKTATTSSLGFTLIELLVVLAIVALLSTIALPRYFQSIDKGKEVILVENLRLSRDAIDKFYADRGRYPNSLNELVELKYLRSLPIDPITSSSQTWNFVAPKNESEGAIADLFSGAEGRSLEGIPFSDL